MGVLGRTTSSMTSESATTSSNVTASATRRKQRTSQQVVPKTSNRALRSRSGNANIDASNGVSSRVRVFEIYLLEIISYPWSGFC